MNKEIVLSVPKEVEKSRADQIIEAFNPAVQEIEDFRSSIDEVKSMETSPEKSAKAKRVRLDIAKVRISADKVRIKLKEKILREGQAIDGTFKYIKLKVNEIEDSLKDIETYYEKIEEARIQKIQDQRASQLSEYDVDVINMDLGNMTDDIFNNLLIGSKAQWQAAKDAEKKVEEARVETERKQKEYDSRLKALLPFGEFFDPSKLTLNSTEDDFSQLIADAKFKRTEYLKNQKEISLENERLKKEADEREALRISEEKKQAKIREKEEAKLEAERIEQQKILKAEQEAREKLEREQAEKAEQERTRIAKEKDEAKKKALAPDKDKLIELASTVISLNVNSDLAQETIRQAHDIIISAVKKM